MNRIFPAGGRPSHVPRTSLALVALALLTATPPARALVLGGGDASKDCRVVYQGVDATSGASGVVCLDGDPTCDTDGAVNGVCRFAVRICTGIATHGCTPEAIDGITTGGLSLPTPAGGHACGTEKDVDVPVGKAVGSTLVASAGGGVRDVDYLNLCCRAEAGPFDAAICALAVKPTVSGCPRKTVPAPARNAFLRARSLVAQAAANPDATTTRRRAQRALDVVKTHGQRVSGKNTCGFALGLVATHAKAALSAVP